MNERYLILTIGLPRSGKSTWAQQSGLPIVCPDAIRLAIHGMAFYPDAEAIVWATAHIMVRSLFIAGHSRVVLDATNITKRRRDEWKDHRWECLWKIFDTTVEECISRAIASNRKDLIPIITHMAQQRELPETGGI